MIKLSNGHRLEIFEDAYTLGSSASHLFSVITDTSTRCSPFPGLGDVVWDWAPLGALSVAGVYHREQKICTFYLQFSLWSIHSALETQDSPQ